MKPYFQDEQTTIYHGDSLEVLASLSPVDGGFIFTDPPYNVGMDYGEQVNDSQPPEVFLAWTALWLERARLVAPTMSVYTPKKWLPKFWNILGHDFHQIVLSWNPHGRILNRYISQYAAILTNAEPGKPVKDHWGGIKSTAQGFYFHEDHFDHPGYTSEHVTGLALSRLHDEAGTVIDPFSGTGTSLYCAKARGMKGIGIEKEERWCEIAAERLSQGVLALS